MLCGYSIIAVPTGIVTSEMRKKMAKTRLCDRCGNSENENNTKTIKKQRKIARSLGLN